MTTPATLTSRRAFAVEPIGVVHSPYKQPAAAPRQPAAARETEGTIELFAGRGLEFALEDLAPGDALWVLFWFHLSPGWRPKVRPPRSPRRRGLFATRAPHRPNPIGMSVVELLGLNGLLLEVRGVDMLDETPVLDLKPYIPYTDRIASDGPGWLGAPADPVAQFDVELSALASAQLEFLRERGTELREGLESALRLGPSPHPYRRIRKESAGYVLSHKEWRARFSVLGTRVRVESIATGFRARELGTSEAPALAIHRQFVERFGYPGHGTG